MKKILFLGILCSLLMSCNEPTQVLQAIDTVGCDASTALANAFGQVIASTTGANAALCGPALLPAFGGAYFCATPIPASSPVSGVAAQVAKPKYATIGQIPGSVLHPYSKPSGMKAKDAI